jgi:hypothetical protein
MTYSVQLSGASAAVEVYGGLAACDDYLLAAVGKGAARYRALSAGGDERKRLLVAATRWIDALSFAGSATYAAGTTLAVPRSDVTLPDGSTMTALEQLQRVARATFEAVAALAVDADAASKLDTGSNIKSVGGEGAPTVEFWRPTSAADGTAPVLPIGITRALGPLLGGSVATASGVSGGAYAGGTSRASSFDDCDAHDRTGPF